LKKNWISKRNIKKEANEANVTAMGTNKHHRKDHWQTMLSTETLTMVDELIQK